MWYTHNGSWCNTDALDNYGEINYSELNKTLQATIRQTAREHGLTVNQLTSISYVIRFSGNKHEIYLHHDNGKDEFAVMAKIPVKVLRRFYHSFKDKYLYPVR